MWNRYQIDFLQPWHLLLVFVLPLLWWLSYRGLSGLGRFRRVLALALRSLVLLLLVAALAECQLVRKSEDLTVTFLLDQSLSIPPQMREMVLQYFNESVARYRAKHPKDKAGAVIFGKSAELEIPPFDVDSTLSLKPEVRFDPEHTNLASAIRLAQATFPHDTAKRMVVVSDFNENQGDALAEARGSVDAGIALDLLPIQYGQSGDVAVEKVTLPEDVRRDQPFSVRVVLNNTSDPSSPGGGVIKGRLRLEERSGSSSNITVDESQPVDATENTTDDAGAVSGADAEEQGKPSEMEGQSPTSTPLLEQEIAVPPGKKVYTLQAQISSPNFYTYEATFIPDQVRDDARPQNNQALGFTHVRGKGQVLLIEDFENPGEFEYCAERLRQEGLEVTIRPSGPGDPFNGLNELLTYDSVVLANVPREHFTDEQIKALVANNKEMGAGLVMMGGPNSFGAGGWTNTPVEEAMPVEFQIKNSTVVPVGALVMTMHASEIAQGNYWQKVIGELALKQLGAQDYCGVIHFDGADRWLWGAQNGLVRVGPNRQQMLVRLAGMSPGDMPAFDPGMIMAHKAFMKCKDAATRHMIVISDGDPSPPSPGALTALKNLNVKISTVAVGAHGPAEHQTLRNIATQTGGKYYKVNNPNLLPRIYMREARRVARPLVFERPEGMTPQVVFDHEMVRGIPPALAPITGYVLTSVKDAPGVEVAVRSPLPVEEKYSTVLAGWQHGLGRSVAFTTDAGKRWASQWTGWENYDQLFSQIVRWSMRPAGDNGKFTVSTEVRDGKGRVVINALDQNDEFLNFLSMNGRVLGPDIEPIAIDIRQTAPGRYIGEFDASKTGVYITNILPGGGAAPIRVGMNSPYSREFAVQQANLGLAQSLNKLTPVGMPEGELIAPKPGAPFALEELLAVNPFRHDLPSARSSQGIWHLLLLAAAVLFFFDVFIRRVAIDLSWMTRWLSGVVNYFAGRETTQAPDEYLSRLRSRKAEVNEKIEQQQASATFEATPEQLRQSKGGLETEAFETESLPRAAPSSASIDAEPESYTERLLRAKRKAREEGPQNDV